MFLVYIGTMPANSQICNNFEIFSTLKMSTVLEKEKMHSKAKYSV